MNGDARPSADRAYEMDGARVATADVPAAEAGSVDGPPAARMAAVAGGAALALGGGALLYYKRTSDARERRPAGAPEGAPEVRRVITIGRSPRELYDFWRDPGRLLTIMAHFAHVSAPDGDHAHWRIPGPLGQGLEWDSAVVEDRPGEFLRWKSLDGAGVPNEGSLEFRPAPGGRGTEVTLTLRFAPPGGAIGDAATRRLGIVPAMIALKALRRFKSLVESGEVPTLAHNPSARKGRDAA